MVVAKDPIAISLSAILYVLSYSSYHLTLCSNNISTQNEIIIDNKFLSGSIILLYMYQHKNVHLILIVSF